MAIQIITDFNATAKICAVSDDKHVEVYMEGQAGEIVKNSIRMLAKAVYSAAEGALENEEIRNALETGEGMTDKDAAVVFLAKHAIDDFQEELAKLKTEEMLKEFEGAKGVPDAIIGHIAEIIAKGMTAAAKELKKENESEGEDDDE